MLSSQPVDGMDRRSETDHVHLQLTSALSAGKDSWQERYVVLTRKGIHFYVRQPNGTDLHSRDIFGQHDVSIGLSVISRVDAVRGRESDKEEAERLLRCIVVISGGKSYHLKAETSELLERWYSALQSAIGVKEAPSPTGSSSSSQKPVLRSPSARRILRSRSMGSSFNRVPTIVDFRTFVRTDNLLYVCLSSSNLALEILLESGLPWGEG